MVDEVGHQWGANLGVTAGEAAVCDRGDGSRQFGIADDIVAGPIPLGQQVPDFLHGEAEQEEVLRAGFLAHLDVGPVEGADGQRPIHHELHVSGARRFFARGGDLLGEVRARIDQLPVLHVEVRDESDLHLTVDGGVVVDRLGDGVDQLDDQLGDEVAGCRLAAENESARSDLKVRVGLEPVVERDDVQRIEVLTLVFVYALDLNVEHPIRVEIDAGPGFDVVGQPGLVLPLDGDPALLERRVIGVAFQATQFLQIYHPALADGLVEKFAKTWVGQSDEPTGRDAVGLVEEPLRPHFVEVFEDGCLDQFGMHRGDTVDRVAADGRQMGHPDVAVAVFPDQRHPTDARVIAGEPGPHLVEEAAVDLVDDFQVPRQEPLEHVQRPGFQRLGQQGVVGVGQRCHGNLPGLIPAEAPLVDQQPHQLGNGDRRVSVVELDGNSVRQVMGGEAGEVLQQVQDVLQRAGYEEVLLQQS